MAYYAIGKNLPKFIVSPLFGDREHYGYTPDIADPSWKVWRKLDQEFYDQNQRRSVGAFVNAAGHQIMRWIELRDLCVLEIGPGALDHIAYWRNEPTTFVAADIRPEFLVRAEQRLRGRRVQFHPVLVDAAKPASLPLPDASVDVVLSFYSLEHMYPLSDYLREIRRVLKPAGRLIGAIPCEGGLAWGLGRYFTTRRWLKAHGCAEPDKIISWEHPNFADDILNALDREFERQTLTLWPLAMQVIDLNLIARFIYRKC